MKSPIDTAAENATGEDANLPELDKTLIAYKTSKQTKGRRPWLDPEYVKVGRSFRIANGSNADLDAASGRNTSSNPGSMDRA